MKRLSLFETGKFLFIFIPVFLFSFMSASTILAGGSGESAQTEEVTEQADTRQDNEPGNVSYLSKLWDLDEETRRGKYTIMPHRSSYILPVTYNSLTNKELIEETSPGTDVLETEVKFQISLKVKLWEDILGEQMDLWFGYTQQSYWQLYNSADSSPFRETNYEPELLLNYRPNFDLPGGITCRVINAGFNHQSNGRSDPLSRSWNRIVGNVGFERDNFVLLVRGWYRIPESAERDDNPDIDDYLGYGEIRGYYIWKKHKLGAMLRNNLHFSTNRGALQLEWSFPLIERVSGYIQFYTGYGESLLDYNQTVNRIGIGLILADWR
jgi:phospholipase A1